MNLKLNVTINYIVKTSTIFYSTARKISIEGMGKILLQGRDSTTTCEVIRSLTNWLIVQL
jgi:hypothetical protein